MKNCYYCTFVAGMEETAAEVVKERLADVSIKKIVSGAVIFETECSYDKLNFFCFNNIFALIDFMEYPVEHLKEKPADGNRHIIERHIRKICLPGNRLSEKSFEVISGNSKKIQSFRLVCSIENKPSPIMETTRQKIEKFIAGNSGLVTNRSKPDTEFWFLYRREGFSLFAKRLTRSSEKNLHPGELSPSLAWLLCRLASLSSPAAVLDPFCGYGAIPKAALKHFPVKKFTAIDIDPNCVRIVRNCSKAKNFEAVTADFFSFPFAHESFDAIISDPPWGYYRKTQIPIAEFYEKILDRFFSILKPNGTAAIIAGKEFEAAAEKSSVMKTEKNIPVLVSGKKASVFVLRKISPKQ